MWARSGCTPATIRDEALENTVFAEQRGWSAVVEWRRHVREGLVPAVEQWAQLEEDDRMPTPHERADWKPKQLFPENLQRVWRRTVERLELAEPEAYVTGFEKGGER